MKPIPTILLVVVSVMVTIFLMSKCSRGQIVTVEKIKTIIERDTIKYPEYIPIEKPVTVTKEKKIYITDQKQMDSLIAHYEREIQVCSDNYEKALSQLYQAHVGDTLIQEQEVKLYAGQNEGENYRLNWQIGTIGELHHFHPTVEVTSTQITKTIDKTKKNAVGLHWGLYGTLDMRPTVAVGLSYDRSWGGFSAIVVPDQGAALLTFNPKIRW